MTDTLFHSRHAHVAAHAMLGAALLLLLGLEAASAHSDHEIDNMKGMHAPAGKFAFGAPGDAAKPDRIVHITMHDLSFEPDALTVKAGETIRFVVANGSAIEHDFTLGDAATEEAHRKEMAEMFEAGGTMHHSDDPNAVLVEPGKTRELTWKFTQPGRLEFDCNIPGHYEAGMKGAIAVTP